MRSRCVEVRRAQPLLGTLVEISVEAPAEAGHRALDAAFAAVAQVHALMSYHAPGSDVSAINAAEAGTLVDIHPWTGRVLARAYQVSQLSHGAFDIASAPALVKAGHLPPPPVPTRGVPQASYRDLVLTSLERVFWRQPGWIDLGGIAKGFAVDRAVAELRRLGMHDGMVNAGGDLRCFGVPQAVQLRWPESPGARLGLGRLANAAIATSAGYFTSPRPLSSVKGDALVDPLKGRCVSWEGSVSVVADDCTTADAFTKVVRLCPDQAPALCARLGVQALHASPAGLRSCGPVRLVQEELT